MQNYERLYWYLHDYQDLVYRYYSKHAIAFLTTYYNLDKDDTVWDNVNMLDGAYERVGELTGIKFNKILLLPVFFITEVTTSYDGSEIGYIKEGNCELVIPSSYNFIPYEGDIVKMEQDYLRPTNDIYPTFMVTGREKSVNTNITFFKLKVEIFQSKTTEEVDRQVDDTLAFLNYTKKIYMLDEATFLAKMIYKNKNLQSQLNDIFDHNSGLYFI